MQRADELFRMNKQWYSDFASRKGFKAERFFQSKAIISLCGLGLNDNDLVRVFRAVIPDDEEASEHHQQTTKLCGFLITCRLSETYWAGVLSRSLFEYSGLGHYLWHKAAQVYLQEGVPLENDGPGGFDQALCDYKQRFSSQLLNTYRIWSE